MAKPFDGQVRDLWIQHLAKRLSSFRVSEELFRDGELVANFGVCICATVLRQCPVKLVLVERTEIVGRIDCYCFEPQIFPWAAVADINRHVERLVNGVFDELRPHVGGNVDTVRATMVNACLVRRMSRRADWFGAVEFDAVPYDVWDAGQRAVRTLLGDNRLDRARIRQLCGGTLAYRQIRRSRGMGEWNDGYLPENGSMLEALWRGRCGTTHIPSEFVVARERISRAVGVDIGG